MKREFDPALWQRRGLWLATALVGGALLVQTAQLLTTLWASSPLDKPETSKRQVPDYLYESWYSLAVQDGRTKPFQTVCLEAVRQITGSSRFEGLDPVAVVLAWMLEGGGDWETHPFILCDHLGLRRQILAPVDGAPAADENLRGRFVSPAELRRSHAFDRLLESVGRKRKEMQSKAHLELTNEHLKAEEVGRRLLLYDELCGKGATRLFKNALVGDAFVDLSEAADLQGSTPEEALAALIANRLMSSDRLHLVGLDEVPGSRWFSMSELRLMQSDPTRWQRILAQRRQAMPISNGGNDVAANRAGEESLATVQPFPKENVDAVLQAFAAVRAAYASGEAIRFNEASHAFFHILEDITDDTTMRGLVKRRNTNEAREAFARYSQAKRAATDQQLRHVKSDFFAAADEASRLYPGVTTISWELAYNRWQPFRWAWVVMLAALLLLALGLGLGSRICFAAGLGAYIGSLALQTVGFAMRMAISGRAPVSNMYESVIFAAFMAAIFALILEAIYRRGPIAVTGAALAILGLLLADQLPLTLDPKISPIVPVLRTNYWLTVHVLTITSSYAAGTLAWGLGNLTLALVVFGKNDAGLLKTLAQYTYRALQIAVLLLAAGTFLGGWWAADAWGRFWGWDPKEVGALIALVAYVIPLHARYLGWLRDFGLAVCAVLCYASILLSWYVVNFLVASGLHSYGFSAGGGGWVLWACLLNVEWVLVAAFIHQRPLLSVS